MCTRLRITAALGALALSLSPAGCVAGASPGDEEEIAEAEQAWCGGGYYGGYGGYGPFGPPPVIWTAPGVFWSGPGYAFPYLRDFTGATFSPAEGDYPWL